MSDLVKMISSALGIKKCFISEPQTLIECILEATDISYNIRLNDTTYMSKNDILEMNIDNLISLFNYEVYSSILGGALSSGKRNTKYKNYKNAKNALKDGDIHFGIQEYISDYYNINT